MRLTRQNITLLFLCVLTLILGVSLLHCQHHKALVEADLTRAVSRGVSVEAHWILCKQKCSQCD